MISLTGGIPLTRTGSTITLSTPVYMKSLGGKYLAGAPVQMTLSRLAVAAANSLGQVWGANIAHWFNDNSLTKLADGTPTSATKLFRGDGSTVNFTTDLAYAAWSNYNWIAMVGNDQNQTLRVYNASPSGTQFAVANVGGAAQIQFATAPALNQLIVIAKVAPVSLYSGTDRTKLIGDDATPQVCYDVLWVANDDSAQATPTSGDGTTVNVTPLGW